MGTDRAYTFRYGIDDLWKSYFINLCARSDKFKWKVPGSRHFFFLLSLEGQVLLWWKTKKANNLYNVHAYVVIILKLSQRFGTWVKKKRSHNQMLVNEPKHTTSNLRSVHTLLQHTLSQLIIYCNVVELWTCSNSNTERCVQSSGDFIGRHWVMLTSDEYFHKCCTWFNAPKFCTWMCLPDSKKSLFSIPKKNTILRPFNYTIFSRKTPNLAQIGCFCAENGIIEGSQNCFFF